MGKTLVIVESPAKAKTIGRYLGKDYQIAASVGHVRDLPTSSLGVDVNNDFEPRYIPMRGKDKVIKELKAAAKTADNILLAPDPDREGEAIAWHLATILKIDPASPCRITFNEITERAVKEAVKNPRPIDMDLVNSQQARRILDRLVGYELSPLLWKKVRTGLSAGRVQSVATQMVVEREREIDAFIPEEYWLLDVLLETDAGEQFTGRYYGTDNNGNPAKVKLTSEEETNAVIARVKGQPFSVRTIRRGTRQRRPYAPFTTSTLQQDASSRLGFTSSRTMRIAQQLYEGIDLPDIGPTALVTYIRTDSVRISDEATEAARDMIQRQYGKDYVPAKPNQYKNKNAAQNAHEAIRPAHFDHAPDDLKENLSSDQYRLYRLIWERFLASQMTPAKLATLRIDSVAGGETFRTTGQQIIFPGFLAAYGDVEKKSSTADDDKQTIPPLEEGQDLKQRKLTPQQKFTQPPARYTEASLIKAMEDEGIGRPSTYAPTISTILNRRYVEKENKSLKPTNLGTVVTELLENNFTNIVDPAFTARMEEELDTVEAGEENWVDLLDRFYPPFHEEVESAMESVEKVQLPEPKTGEKCPVDGGDLIIKEGRYGKFIACNNFPDCNYTASYAEKIDAVCPSCGSQVLSRKSRRNRTFYVCDKSKDPECEFISWDIPLAESCTTCGHYMVSKTARGNTFKKCSNPDCPTNERKSKARKPKQSKTGMEDAAEAAAGEA